MGRYKNDSKRISRVLDNGIRYLDPGILFDTTDTYRLGASEDHDRNSCNCRGDEGDGCDGYGRCSTISNAHLTKGPDVKAMLAEMLLRPPTGRDSYRALWNAKEKFDPYEGADPFFAYAVERILCHTGVRKAENWSVEVSRGYYGEEVDGISLKSEVANDAYEHLATVFGLDDPDDLMKHILKVEYGYLLPVLEPKLRWSFEKWNKKAVIAANTDHFKRLDRDIVKSYDEKYTGPRGVAVQGDGAPRLLDGYHRFAGASDSVTLIVGRP